MQKKIVIGIAGNSRCGKDTLYKVLKTRFDIGRVSVGDIIKSRLKNVLSELDLDPFTESLEKKNLARPILAEYGVLARKATNGKFFIDRLPREVYICKSSLVAITDVRFAEYDYDELQYVKENGILVYLTRYRMIDGEKAVVAPANKYEAENNPILENSADIKIEWPTAVGEIDDHNLKILSTYCGSLFKKIQELTN